MSYTFNQELVGVQEIADALGKDRQEIVMWRHRKKLPEPFAVISNTPIWKRKQFFDCIMTDDFITKRLDITVNDKLQKGVLHGAT